MLIYCSSWITILTYLICLYLHSICILIRKTITFKAIFMQCLITELAGFMYLSILPLRSKSPQHNQNEIQFLTHATFVPQVRAAAVYALGMFISNVSEKSDHANSIDLGVGMRLVQVVGDGSPLVRKVRTFSCPFCLYFLKGGGHANIVSLELWLGFSTDAGNYLYF